MIKAMSHANTQNLLRKAGISTTPQRLAVLSILQQATRPLSIGEIRKILDSQSTVNKVTVYRIISALKNRGIIRDVLSAGGAVCFEMATSDHPVHPHFSCTGCGTLSCLTPLTFSQVRQLLNQPDNHRVDHIEINISGLCNGCLHATKLHKQMFKKG